MSDYARSVSDATTPEIHIGPALNGLPVKEVREDAPTQSAVVYYDFPRHSPLGAVMPSVDVATVGRVASGLVCLVCMASFAIGVVTGFYAIFPPMSLLIAAIAALLCGLSVALAKQWRR